MKSNLSLSLLVGFLVYFCFGMSRLIILIFITNDHFPSVAIGNTGALFYIIPLVFAIKIGDFISKNGPRKPLALGTCLFQLGVGILFIDGSLYAIYASAFLIGAAFTIMQIALQFYIGAFSNASERTRNFGYASVFQSVAIILSSLASGYVFERYGFKVSLALDAAIISALLVVVFLGYRRFGSIEVKKNAALVVSRSIVDLLKSKNIQNTMVAGALLAMCWDLHSFMVPLLSRQASLSPIDIGFILGAFSAAAFISRIALTRFTHVDNIYLIKAALLIVGVCFSLYSWFIDFAAMTAFAVVLGFVLGLAQPTILSLIHDVSEKESIGKLLGIRTIVGNLGAATLPICLGLIDGDGVYFALTGIGFVLLFSGFFISIKK